MGPKAATVQSPLDGNACYLEVKQETHVLVLSVVKLSESLVVSLMCSLQILKVNVEYSEFVDFHS